MKITLLLASLLLSITSLAAETPTYLFVQHASSAEIKQTDGHYTLILKQIPSDISYFTERPIRKTGKAPAFALLKLWQENTPNNFSVSPPNTVISGVREDDQTYSVIVELTNPVYYPKTNELHFDLSFPENSTIKEPILNLRHPTVIYDGVHWNCSPFC